VATSLRYPPAGRLRQPTDFVALRREGKRVSSRYFHTQYRLTQSGEARLGMAVSRRVSKRAVVRNRIRRTVRESFRICRGRLPLCDVLLVARAEAATQSAADLRSDLDLIWSQLAALKPQLPTSTIPPHP
jgi:ribonuclease P protein component